jgi:diguanylate cyclase (GGDEF)-like protein/PAS domain S-box-containing protein
MMGDSRLASTLRRAWPQSGRERLVPVAGVLGLLSAVWFVLSLTHLAPPAWGWTLVPVNALLFACASLAAGSAAGQPPAVRRFWRQIGVGSLIVVVGLVLRAYHSLTNTDPSRAPLHATDMAIMMVAVGVFCWALLRLPLGLVSRTQRWAFALDVCTVLGAATLVWWQFVYRMVVLHPHNQGVLVALATEVLGQVVLFAFVKVAMTGQTTVDTRALRLLGLSVLIATVGTVPDSVLSQHSVLTTTQTVLPLACWMATRAARRQWRAAHTPPREDATRRRRMFSVLPYIGVLATDGLLLASTGYRHQSERLVIASGVVALAVLVMARQFMAFRENSRLVVRLDDGMVELRDHERRFRSLVQNSSDIITITNGEGILTYVSPGVTAVLGWQPQDWIGRPALELLHSDDLGLAYHQYLTVANESGATTSAYQVRQIHADGSWRWMEITSSNLLRDPGVAGIVGNARDITQARELQQRLSHQASHDTLTQLANRALFGERIEAALDAAPDATAVVLVDLNEFKAVNDSLGHAVGDELLVAAAERLRRVAPRGATVARLGGDEFAVLLVNAAESDLDALAEDLVRGFQPPVPIDGRQVRVAASIGLAHSTGSANADELLRRADVAMYAAKAGGERRHTRFARYTPSIDRAFTAQTRLESDLQRALGTSELHLMYQPVVDLGTSRIVAVEALARWTHPEHGPVPPADFIPIAERTGAIVSLGRWVLREACTQATIWHRRYGEDAPAVNVNVSPRQLHEDAFAGEVAGILAETGLPACRLTVEITESLTADDTVSWASVEALQRIGVRIAIDDFGTGHSDLALLDRYPVDELKLDRSFTGIGTGPGQPRVASAVIDMAEALGVHVVAEGIETSGQAEHLASLGFRTGQGYFFAHPLPAEEIGRLLAPSRAA